MAGARACAVHSHHCISFVRRIGCGATFSSTSDSNCYGFAFANANIDSSSHRDSHSITNKYEYTDCYGYTFANIDSDSNGNFYTNTNPDSESDSNSNCHRYIISNFRPNEYRYTNCISNAHSHFNT